MIKILIADDHNIFREGLKRIFADTADIEVGDEASSGHEALEQMRSRHWDVVLLDINLPGKSGLDVLKQIKTEKPDLPVLILSMHPEEQYAVRAIKLGASGYLSKDTDADELLIAIRKAAAGGRYASRTLADHLLHSLYSNGQQLHTLLSDREHLVFRQIVAGKSLTEIAQELSLSIKTISTYRARLLEKMGMTNNAELIRHALEHQLFD
ncbi:MAG: response regulator transcription factor [Sulfuricella denitrificans]|nr:response regulator transcription factor [Sulfuricella denitrificans]